MAEIHIIDSLNQFLNRGKITIQCHNYPDADSIGSGFALWQYFTDHGVAARLVYGGAQSINKCNLQLFVKNLHIPIEYVPDLKKVDGLLITVDCQYLSSNISRIEADEVLMIDHHLQGENIDKIRELTVACHSCIKEFYGSCASLIYQLFQRSSYHMNLAVSTALYYGLFMDTSEFSEVRHPADREARDELFFDDEVFTLLKNSNLSPDELKQAGASLQNYDARGTVAVIECVKCDPNVLGLIADMLIRVENITTAIAYNRIPDHVMLGKDIYKFSVRSCLGEIRANELAELVAAPSAGGRPIGGGGGHRLKAGGRVDVALYESYAAAALGGIPFKEYLYRVFDEYSSAARIIYSNECNVAELLPYAEKYEESLCVMGYLCSTELAEAGRSFLIRNSVGDLKCNVSPDLYIVVYRSGNVTAISRKEFKKEFAACEGPIRFTDFARFDEPRISLENSATKVYLQKMLHPCTLRKVRYVWAVPIGKLKTPIKLVDSKWAVTDFKFGNISDFLIINTDGRDCEISIADARTFREIYRPVPAEAPAGEGAPRP